MTINGELWLIVKQPYLEGMFPFEYTILLKAIKELRIPYVNCYLEASGISDPSLNNNVHRVKYYYNKRFYKYTEEGFTCVHDIES